ncbi:MAG: hypothetical protein K1X52_14935 [Pyrinomonadaceae bacterium]|jgi:hypothetical protein|nr:hypothetical protein [Pyrinomonadaceae bacterium]
MKYITREYVKANPDKLFLFGDNLEDRGFGGQAAAMRGEPNAVGIPTKKKPSMDEDAFFTDNEFELNKSTIEAALSPVFIAVSDNNITLVIPADGLGTGRAELDRRAPQTFAYLQRRLADLEAFIG